MPKRRNKMIAATGILAGCLLFSAGINKESLETPEINNCCVAIQETAEESLYPETTISEENPREITDEEYNLLLRVCMSEAGGEWGEPHDGKVAVVESILNRVDMGYGTIKEVIEAPNQFSTANNGEPDETVKAAVDEALSGDTYPDNMIYFRTGGYHSFGTPYKQIGNHYFSLRE